MPISAPGGITDVTTRQWGNDFICIALFLAVFHSPQLDKKDHTE
jgi:hypothetical protein